MRHTPVSLYEPRIFAKYLKKKRQQLSEVRSDLNRLPLDHPSRPRLLERMLVLREGIPDLEHEYARRINKSNLVNPRFLASSNPKVETKSNRALAGGSKRGRPINSHVETRARIIREVTKKGFRGQKYCEQLKKSGLLTPIEWRKTENCPPQYIDAYMHQDPVQRIKWRQRIYDEKYRATKSSPRQN